MAVVSSLPDASLDAIVMDPPYCGGGISESQRTSAKGQGLRSENLNRFGWFTGDNMTTAGLLFLLRAIAFEATRIVKPTGAFVVFCDHRMQFTLGPGIESAGLRYQEELIWNKQAMGMGNGFRKQHEKAMVFTFGSPKFHAADVPTVIDCPRVRGDDREHQTQKPVQLLRRILRVVSPKGGVVLDPFAGSGSLAVAAMQEGMGAIVVERDADHCETIRRRVHAENGTTPGTLFAGTVPTPDLFADVGEPS